jgi:hypothetical protein
MFEQRKCKTTPKPNLALVGNLYQGVCTYKTFYENITIILRECITCRKLDRNSKHIFCSESMGFEDMMISTCKKVYKYRPRDNNVIIILQMNVIVM